MKNKTEVTEFLENFDRQKKEFEEKNPGKTLIMHYDTDPFRHSVHIIKKDAGPDQIKMVLETLKAACKAHENTELDK